MVNVTIDPTSGSLITTDRQGVVYVYNPGDIAWTLCSTALVWFMIPAVGFFYSGLLRRKNALSMIYLSAMTAAVVTLQWFLLGFSLTFAETTNGIIGDLRHVGLRNVLEEPAITSKAVPTIVFCAFQLMFAAFTPMLAIGATAERGRIGPQMVFVFLWATLVYDFIAYWVWNPNGWASRLPTYDFAGGTPVHISSGVTALAISIHLGPRIGFGTPGFRYPANNVSYVALGTAMMWFGWMGFNGGSALSANLRATNAVIVSNIAACSGALTYALCDYYWRRRPKWGMVNLCSGAIDGLIAITPAAGFVGAPAAVLYGVVAGIGCNWASDLFYWMGIDDALDIGASHFVGGLIGNLLTGIFAQKSIAGSDGVTVNRGGWLDGNWIQLAYQLADSVAGASYAFVVTLIICRVMHYIPGLSLRVEPKHEQVGIDFAEMGENFDAIEHTAIEPPPTPTSHVEQYRGDPYIQMESLNGYPMAK